MMAGEAVVSLVVLVNEVSLHPEITPVLLCGPLRVLEGVSGQPQMAAGRGNRLND